MPCPVFDDAPLAARLLEAALARLNQAPAEELSMRQVARDVGVSHQAPYVHFGSRQVFLAAVAGAGMVEATKQAREHVAAAGAHPAARLHALADAYLCFIRDRPHVHDLANGPTVAKSDHPLLQSAAIDYWNLLHDTVAACQPEGISEADVLRRAAVAWSAVYGIARLSTFAQIPTSVAAPTETLVHEAMDHLLAAWQQN